MHLVTWTPVKLQMFNNNKSDARCHPHEVCFLFFLEMYVYLSNTKSRLYNKIVIKHI